MTKRSLILRGCGVLALLTMTQTSSAETAFRNAKLDAAGVWISPLDNPIFDTDITLSGDEEAFRGSDASVGEYFSWSYFELHLRHTCTTDDALCMPVSGDRQVPDRDTTMCTWPRVANHWTGNQGVPVEHHGLGIGTQVSTVELRKYRDGLETTLTPSPVPVKLDPTVIVVPVNVIHVIPSASVDAASAEVAETNANPEIYQALFDDRWTMKINTASSQWHRPEYLAGAWSNRSFVPLASSQRSLSSPYRVVLPDDVFAQCGIQYRLQSVTIVRENDPEIVNTTACPSRSQRDGQIIRSHLTRWIKTAVVGPGGEVVHGAVEPDALNAVFVPWVSTKSDCNVASVGDPGYIGFGYVQNNISTNFQSLTVSHELGHALGLADLTGAGYDKHLMFAYGGPAHISGCHRRDGVLLDELPLGCAPLPGESNDSDGACGIAREGARNILDAIANDSQGWSAMEPAASGAPLTSTWTLSTGGAATFNSTISTEGAASLEIPGGTYVVASSPVFKTADIPEVGDQLSVDVYLDGAQPNPYWLGSVDAFASIPGAGLYNAYLGHVELTGMTLDEWHTVSFPVTESLHAALMGDFPVGQIMLALNTPQGAPTAYLDGLAFTGTLEPRATPHAGPLGGGASNAFLSFEHNGDWTATNGSAILVNEWTDGATSLGIDGTGYVEFVSRPFQTDELPAVTPTVTVDIKPSPTTPNPYWLGFVQMFVSCPSANIYNQQIGQHELQNLFQGEFNTLEFGLTPQALTALSSSGQTCSFKYVLNVAGGSGQYLFDHVSFH